MAPQGLRGGFTSVLGGAACLEMLCQLVKLCILPIPVPLLRGWVVCADARLGSSSGLQAKVDSRCCNELPRVDSGQCWAADRAQDS